MCRMATGVMALLLLVAVSRTQENPKDNPKASKPQTTHEQYQALEKEFRTAQQDFMKAYREAKTDEERQQAFAKSPKPQAYVGRFLELAEKNAKDPVAANALIWIVVNAPFAPEAGKAIDRLIQDHIQSDKLGPVCPAMVYSPSPAAEKLFRAVLESNPHKEVQGQACFGLAQYLKNHSERPNAAESKKQALEAEKLFEQVVTKYADVKAMRKTLGELAKSELFEIRNLAIGKTAPDIEGEDIDGKKFKLSDYRGKVVVLDFWGHW